MEPYSVLPSKQFTLVASSIAVSIVLVFAADYIVGRNEQDGQLAPAAAPTRTQADEDWQATLARIQAENPALPPPPPEDAYKALLADAQSSTNITDAVSRSLFVNLSNAGLQGLGSDVPTQEELVSTALAELDARVSIKTYATSDLTIVADSPETLRAYGNTAMAVLQSQPRASMQDTYLAIGLAVDNDDRTYFDQLAPIETAYRAIAEALLAIPVPQTLAPLHLSVVNTFFQITASYADLRAMPDDTLRGLAGLHRYQALAEEASRVFTTIAQQLRQNAILFGETEPGKTWNEFLSVSS